MTLEVIPEYDEARFLDAEAHRYMQTHDITEPEAFGRIKGMLAQEHFRRAIQPWVDAKVQLFAATLTHYVMNADGTLEATHDLTQHQRNWLAEIERHIEAERKRWADRAGVSEKADP